MTASRSVRHSAVLTLMMLSIAPGWAQQTPTQIPGVRIEVISTTPLPGVDLSRDQIPAPTQSLTSEDLKKTGALDFSDFLNRRLTDVHVNEIQGNPYQTDVNYRGYTASPLLGTPQGLSVYMDGVRMNQSFGEAVNWDLIPTLAISSATLMPGSNPLFGLNTLGGALSIHTKDGKEHPGGSIQALYGSHRRKAIEFEYGGSNDRGWNWYFAGNRFGEDGWRVASHTDIRQYFGKFGRQDEKSDVSLTLAYANNSLNGSGLQDNRLLAADYTSSYTKPDNTLNRGAFINLVGKRAINDRLVVSGNAYYRDTRTDTLNADINEGSLDQSMYQPGAAERAALAAAGYTGVPASGATAANTPFPYWRCIGNVLLQDEPAEKCNGLINRSRIGQHNFGFSSQFTLFSDFSTNKNQFTGGGAFDRSRVGFRQSTQLGYINPDHSITGVPAFGDGVTGGQVDGEPFDARVDLDGIIRTWSLFATNTYSLSDQWHFTVSGRYNRTRVENSDRILPGGGAGSLDGDHTFQRLNPAAGVTFSPTPNVNLYFGYAEGSRAATSIELGCADPEQPCKLPNAMAGDPPLSGVVTRTWEGGARGSQDGLTWNAGYFFAQNYNDILFVTSTQSGFGYFRNFGKTRRQGFEVGLSRVLEERLTIGSGYTFLDARYQTRETTNGTGNSSNEEGPGFEGPIEIEPGDRLALIPRHALKAFVEWQATDALSFDLNLVAASSSLARGNENNLHEPDGVYYFGPGRVAGYGVLHAGARLRIHPKVELIAQLNNVLNKRYATAGQLGSTGFTSEGNFIARPFPAVGGEFPVMGATFIAPAAPRAFWVGTRMKF